jgi:hypothetical protein
MRRCVTIVEHESGSCSMLTVVHPGTGTSMGSMEGLAAALVRQPGLSTVERLAIIYEAIRSARRMGIAAALVSESVRLAGTDADREEKRLQSSEASCASPTPGEDGDA